MPRHKRARREFSADRNLSHERQRNQLPSVSGGSRGKQWHKQRSNFTQDCSSSRDHQTNSGETCTDELEIPGFYYDKEKKRYFKIAPNHATSTCNYTRDAISKKQAEIKRQNDIDKIFKTDTKGVQQTRNKKCFSNNLTALIQDRLVFGHNKFFLKSNIFRNNISHIKPVGSQNVFDPHLLSPYENLEHMQVMHTGKEHDEILSLWCIKETWVQRIQRVKILESLRTEKQTSLSVTAQPQLQAILPMLNKVTDLCWAPVSDTGKHVLYTTMCHMGHQESLALIKSLDPGDTSACQDYNLGKKATWTCAWNRTKCQFSVGSEKCVLVLNVERRTMWEYNTNKSDPLSLAFSRHSGNSLHTGTRHGQIMTFDMRSRSTFPVCTLSHHSSVCSVKDLENDNYLLASDFTGKVCLWDLRKKKILVQYPGNVNQYSRLPVHVDELQKIVYTVGEDGYTRFWSLDQGKQLYTIPPPCSVSRETIPCVQLSSRWGNRDGNMGLIMGLKNKLYFYGTLPLT
ncbi:DDB1- and CUL4-associated factor 4-like protein 1 [Mercenaria mercenaria]|uniref:DDB1- and CUL4-associated factor 4-like protein 1 n=1 Tax=Mercenaria mercenaria TaxID=6596 RepID=UPI00234E902D|nr:DDB1- and CUL4-associated factor 4-like protein 1 [Mercenaria mercenaria]